MITPAKIFSDFTSSKLVAMLIYLVNLLGSGGDICNQKDLYLVRSSNAVILYSLTHNSAITNNHMTVKLFYIYRYAV